jgi:hypothetical protein
MHVVSWFSPYYMGSKEGKSSKMFSHIGMSLKEQYTLEQISTVEKGKY